MRIYQALNNLVHRLRNLQGDSRKLVKGFSINAGFIVVNRLFGAMKELVVAARFGTGVAADGFAIAFTIVSWAPTLVTSLTVHSLVPLLVRLRNQSGKEKGQFDSELIGAAALVGFILMIAMAASAPFLIPFFANEPASSEVLRNAVDATIYMAPFGLLGVVGGMYSSILISHTIHRNTVFEASLPLMTILVLLVWQSPTIGPLALGNLLGALLYCVLAVLTLRRFGLDPGLALPTKSESWKSLGQSTSTISIGVIAMSITPIVDQFLAISLGPGANSSIGYAMRVCALVIGLFTTAIARTALPVFSNAVQTGDRLLVRKNAARWTWLIFVTSVAAGIVTALLAEFIVRLLFERGSFTASDTQVVTELVQVGIIQLPFYAAYMLQTQLLLANGQFKAMATIASIAAVCKVAAAYALVTPYGLPGIMFSTALFYLVAMLGNFIALSSQAHWGDGGPNDIKPVSRQ